MEKKELITHLEGLKSYVAKYFNRVTAENARDAIDEFDHAWIAVVGYEADRNESRQSQYGLALVIYSVAIYEKKSTTIEEVTCLSEFVREYDDNEQVKYQFDVKQSLFFNLGICWHKLGAVYNRLTVDAYKKYIYYLLTLSCHVSYRPTAYAFRKCSTFLYQSLVNDHLNISSPTTFNDPFDCPITELLRDGDDVSSLILQAYNEGLKIACFSCNTKLPYYDNKNELIVTKKHSKDRKEFLNSLMWAHYADSHHGICIKYRFCNSISELGGDNKNVVSYFKDVKYSSSDMSQYSTKDSITLEDAFFLKGKQWEYENELRYLYFDLNSIGNYATVSIPNCIEAIYFGLKCTKEDRETLINIMKDKRLLIKDLNGKILEERPIVFYQMMIDKKHFGRLKAVKIDL